MRTFTFRCKNFTLIVVLSLAFLFIPSSSPAGKLESFAFTFFVVPGNPGTAAYGINNRGDIVGEFTEPLSGLTSGFLRKRAFHQAPDGSYTILDPPGDNVTFAVARGINDRVDIVGRFRDDAGFHGFLRHRDGTYTILELPSGLPAIPNGINNRGTILGANFLREPDGTFTTIEVPGETRIAALGINDRGAIVGRSFDADGHEQGFLRHPDGTYTKLDFPGTDFGGVRPMGINNRDEITGEFSDFVSEPIPIVRAFLRTSKGEYISITASLNSFGGIESNGFG
jgi:hypothetical protein